MSEMTNGWHRQLSSINERICFVGGLLSFACGGEGSESENKRIKINFHLLLRVAPL